MKNTKMNFIFGALMLVTAVVIYYEQRDFSNNILLVCSPTIIGSVLFLGAGVYYTCKNRKNNHK